MIQVTAHSQLILFFWKSLSNSRFEDLELGLDDRSPQRCGINGYH